MNIFFLSCDPVECAEFHVGVYIGKMLLESVQIMSTVMVKNGLIAPYRATHHNHPSVLWCEKSTGNFEYVNKLAEHLGIKFNREFGKIHKSSLAQKLIITPNLPNITMTCPPQVMPELYHQENSFDGTIRAYQSYICHQKTKYWFYKGDAPDWYKP